MPARRLRRNRNYRKRLDRDLPIRNLPRHRHEYLFVFVNHQFFQLFRRNDLVIVFEHRDRNQFVGLYNIRLNIVLKWINSV